MNNKHKSKKARGPVAKKKKGEATRLLLLLEEIKRTNKAYNYERDQK